MENLTNSKNPFSSRTETDDLAEELDEWDPYPEDKTYLKLIDFEKYEEDIIVIDGDDMKKFDEAIKTIKNTDIIALDTEWKPGNALTYILQISTNTIIYIFDIMKMVRQNEEKKTDQASKLNDIFEDKKIKKIVFGFVPDLENLYKRYRNKYFSCINNAFDLQILYRNQYDQIYSLARLSKKFFGKEIDKEYTMSDWSLRPLKKQMLRYAAMDAFILIKLWEKIQKEAPEKLIAYCFAVKVFDKICPG